MIRPIPQSDSLEERDLAPGETVPLRGIPVRVIQARVATTPSNWPLTREVMTKAGHKDIHTDKWKRCTDKVKASGRGVNAYAVCTSSLGDKSFKGK